MKTFQTLIRNRSLIIIGASESVSNTGNWITMMAVFAILVFRGDGGIIQSSIVFFAGLVPTFLISPFAGWLLDRFDRKKLMILSELFSGFITLGLVFTSNMLLITIILSLQAVTISIMTPARQAVVPLLVSREDLTRANAFFQQLSGTIKIGAPLLAGLIISVIGPHMAVIIDVISFGLSAVVLGLLPPLPPPLKMDVNPALEKIQTSEKLSRILKESSHLRLLFIIRFLAIMLIVSYDVLAPVYIKNILMGDEKIYGTLIALIGGGTLLASLLLMAKKGSHRPWRDIIIGGFLLSFISGSMTAAGYITNPNLSLGLVVFGAFIGGIGSGLLVIQSGTLLQLLSPPSMLGRISGIFQSSTAASQLGGIVLTPLIVPALLSIPGYFMASTALLLIIFCYAILSLRKERKLPAAAKKTSGEKNAEPEYSNK